MSGVVEVECPACSGTGRVEVYIGYDPGVDLPSPLYAMRRCEECAGFGMVEEEKP